MVSPVAVVAKQQLVVVLGGAAKGAALAFDALPGIPLDRDDHVLCELETRRVA